MGRVDLTEPYAIRSMRQRVRESLQMHGEEVVALHMFHTDPDQGVQPRCVCFNDVYQQGDHAGCDLCYGSTFEGGIKELSRAWAMFTTDTLDEKQTRQGEYQPFSHQVQLESLPTLVENDYLLRIGKWTRDHRPLNIFAAYDLKSMTPESLRTGNQLGQDGKDYIGQRGKATQLPRSHAIFKVFGRQISPDFPVLRLDGARR